MRSVLSLTSALVALANATNAVADINDTKMACANAYAASQDLRSDHKFKEAREQLHICTQPTCKDFIVKECTAWLQDVENRMPGVVLAARDSTGHPLLDVSVSIDGVPVVARLDGIALEVNPGAHSFVFSLLDGRSVEQSIGVLEGQKSQLLSVTFPPPREPPTVVGSPPRPLPPHPAATPTLSATSGSGATASPAADQPPVASTLAPGVTAVPTEVSSARSSTVPVVLLSTGAALVVAGGVGLGYAYTINGATEHPGSTVTRSSFQTAKSVYYAAWPAGIVGLGLVGAGAWMWLYPDLLGPSGPHVAVSPTRGGAVLAWSGSL